MVDNVSSTGNTPATPAADSSQAASSKKLYHTPFGDVMVDELATPNLLDAFRNYNPATTASTPSPAAATPQTSAEAARAANEPPPPPETPTLDSEFGGQAYLDDPTGTGPTGVKYKYNQIYFATADTAAKVAAMVGGTVVEKNDMITGGPFKQSDPNQMIQFADGRQVNAGLIANFFNHGYPKSYIDSLLQKETDGTAI
jgi:hypothetical protein